MNKTRFLKTADGIIGRSLIPIIVRIKKCRTSTPPNFSQILFIRPGGIGDAVLLLPSINLLKSKFPDSAIDILCEKRNSGLFGLSSAIRNIYLYDKGLDLFRCLRNTYDAVIDTEQWHRLSAVVANLTGAPTRIGFATNERQKLFTHKVSYSHGDYEMDSFLHLIEPFGVNPDPGRGHPPFIEIRDQGLSNVSALRREDRIVAIFPGASVQERRWGGNRFGDVARALDDMGYSVVILGSAKDKSDAQLIKKAAPRSTDLTGKTSLIQVAAVLEICRLLISADSGLLHIAYAVGTPTVSLFGSGIEGKWAPRGIKHIVLNKHLECSPCTRFGYTPKCKKNVACLSSIHVAEVVEAARTILDTA